ncbi:MAG TPA: tetratricopeptide repeat protein [Pyrinomonadaceae bacterium]|jgi:DNA-binding SARP family transcriptional activator
MTKACPGCGATAPAEARFCRHCGTALRATASTGPGGGETISPLANTVPLPASNVTTSELDAPDELTRAAPRHDPHLSDGSEITISVVRAEPPPDDAQPRAHETDPSARVSSAGLARAAHAAHAAAPHADFSSDPRAASAAAAPDGASPQAAQTGSPAQPFNPAVAAQARAAVTRRRGAWVLLSLLLGGLLLLCVGVAGAWYLVRQRRAPVVTTDANVPPPVSADARQQAQAKLAEAQSLITAGQPVEATARLREAVALDPANAEAHRQLAQLLLESGARQTAIEELRAVTRLDPNDRDAWRQLAEAQAAEGQSAAAADSYAALLKVAPEAAADDRLQLAYAEALRRAGRAEEARALYRRLATSPLADVARASRQRLAEPNAPHDANANTQLANANTNANAAASPAPANQLPTPSAPAPAPPTAAPPARTPAEHYERGVTLWPTDRAAALSEFRVAAAAGNPDAYYYLGLNFAEGRDPRTLGRAELVAALDYFQRARAGRFAAQARRYEEQLGQEFDRRRQR